MHATLSAGPAVTVLGGGAVSDERAFSTEAGYALGETVGSHPVRTRTEATDAALSLAAQARHSLRLFSRNLDTRMYSTEAFCQAVIALTRRHRYSFIRILVQDPTPAIKSNHRLIQPIQQLTSYIGIRRVAADWQDETSAGLLADERGLLWIPDAASYTATVDFHAGPRARSYRQWFDNVWESSEIDPEFRRLLI